MRSRKSRYVTMARAVAAKYGLPPRIFLSMVEHESGWDPAAISPVGAVGLGQIMPGTARTLKIDPFDPRQNLDGAARHLKAMQRQAGNWRDALRAYNQGFAGSQRGPSYGAEYADKILAGVGTYRDKSGQGKRLPKDTGGGLTDLARMLFKDDPLFLKAYDLDKPIPSPTGKMLAGASKSTTRFNGKMLQPGTTWSGTHVTDSLGWGTKTAQDVMAAAGTGVGAPEDGRVVYFHPTGAQGGGSMKFVSDSGYEYWLGHIADGVRPGRYKRGQKIAVIADQDVSAHHLHIDRRKR